MRFPFCFSAASFLLLAAFQPAFAQVEASSDQVQSGTYAVESSHTQIVFSVRHFGFTHYTGMLSGVSGSLNLNTQNMAASNVSVTIPVDSIQTTSPMLNDELKGGPWFNTAQYPTATFQSVSVRPIGHDDAVVDGNLTLHGVTHPETLKVHFAGAGVNMLDKKFTLGFEATGVIKRSDFGVKMFIPYVSDEVQLHIEGAFER